MQGTKFNSTCCKTYDLTPLCVSVVCLVTGCMVTRDLIRLDYAPLSKSEAIKDAGAITVEINAVDVRRNAANIGKKVKELYWSGVIVVENDLAKLVVRALDTEISRRGFSIGPGHVRVSAEINKFFNEFSGVPQEAVGEVILTVRVKKADGTEIHSTQVKGASYVRSDRRTGKYAKIALETALNHAMRQLMSDPSFIDALFENAEKPPVRTNSQPTR